MKKYKATWPDDALPKKVIAMSVTKKEFKIGSYSTFDRELIYSRVVGLVNAREIFQYELAPDTTFTFDDNGDMKLSGLGLGFRVQG